MIKVDKRFSLNNGPKSLIFNELTKSLIMVNHDLIDSVQDEFENKDDSVWCGGRGKVYYLEKLENFLIKEDKFFNKNQKKINMSYRRYVDFCNQNIIYLVLKSVVKGSSLCFLHPNKFEGMKKNMVGDIPELEPDYFPEFELNA